MNRGIFILLSLFLTSLFANGFDPNSVQCSFKAKEFKKMYVGSLGDYEWKKGLSQITKSTGYFDVKELKPKGDNSCQVELKQHQCLTLFMDENWEKKFGTNSPEFSCVNLRTGEVVPTGEIVYKNKVAERMIKMRCPNKNGISECSNDSNSKRGNDFTKNVLKKNKWEMESVCAGNIREPRYFKQGKVVDTALCALTNQKGEALYKVLIPMEYSYMAPLKKLDGKTISYRPKEIKVDLNNKSSMDEIFLNDKSLKSMSGTKAELLAIATRCASRMYTALDISGAQKEQIDSTKKIATKAIANWSDKMGIVIPGDKNQASEEKLNILASYHQNKYGKTQGSSGVEEDTKNCIPLYQQTGLY